jgi:hypothetical protein
LYFLPPKKNPFIQRSPQSEEIDRSLEMDENVPNHKSCPPTVHTKMQTFLVVSRAAVNDPQDPRYYYFGIKGPFFKGFLEPGKESP